MIEITVYTSITGGKDSLIEDQCTEGARFIAFTDHQVESRSWEVRTAYDRFASDRRNARIPKILAHQFVDTKYSLWIDGNMKLLVPAPQLVRSLLRRRDIAMYAHPQRDCTYDEAAVCRELKLDDPDLIAAQAEHYRMQGLREHKGLLESGFILRRHTPKVEAFNNYWWSELSKWCVRDQISLMYALGKTAPKINVLAGKFRLRANAAIETRTFSDWKRDGVVEMMSHLTPQPEPQAVRL